MEKAKWENWTNFLLGIWFFAAPVLINHHLPPNVALATTWNGWIVGFAIAFNASYGLLELKPWEEWMNIALGLWVIASPWVFGYSGEVALMWNSLIVGFMITALSGIALPAAFRSHPEL